MTKKPKVSVLMTAFNREQFIGEAIESVLASTYSNWELIIVDDKSKDKTVEIARAYEDKDERIKVYVNEKNLGDYPNRNKAASYAKGKYLKYLDSDDIIYPHGLEIFIYYMEKYPEAALGLHWRFLQEEGRYPILLQPKEALNHHFNKKGLFHNAPGSVIIRKDAFKKVGGFSGLRQIGDYECWLKIASRYPVLKISFFPMWTRSHEAQEQKFDNAIEKQMMKQIVNLQLFEQNSFLKDNSIKKALIKKTKKRFFKNLLKITIKEFNFTKLRLFYQKYQNRNENCYFSN